MRGDSEHNLLFHPGLLGKTPVCLHHPFHLLILCDQLPPPQPRDCTRQQCGTLGSNLQPVHGGQTHLPISYTVDIKGTW